VGGGLEVSQSQVVRARPEHEVEDALGPDARVKLGEHGLATKKDVEVRVVIEKPFGTDLESALKLNQDVLAHWHEVEAQWIALAVPHPAVSKVVLVTGWANISVTASLAIAAVVCLAQALYELVLLIRWRPVRNGNGAGQLSPS